MPRENLGLQTVEQDVLFIDKNNSIFTNRPQVRYENLVKDLKEFRADTSSDYGDTYAFLPQRSATLLSSVVLKLSSTAIASSGATGDYPRFPDYWPYHVVDKIDVSFANNHLQTLKGDDIFLIHAQQRTTDDNLEDAVDGGLQSNPGQRALNAASARICYLPLPLFFCGALSQALPYDSDVIRQEIRIEITNRSIGSVIETNGSTPTGTLTCTLICEMYHLGEMGVQRVKSEIARRSDLGIMGWSRLCRTISRQSISATDSTSEQTVSLTQLRRPTTEMCMIVRKTANITTAAASARNRYYFEEVASNKFTSSNRDMNLAMDHVYQKYIHNNKMHAADPSLNIYGWTPSLLPDSPNTVMGYTNFTSVGQPEWVFTMNSSHSGAIQVDAFYKTINTYVLNAAGNLRMLYQ